ncbi:MAG: tRNA pseudouridine(38-40) synthase TruA [Gammaproteobacteria bacterium]|nr:tRNA pseudouridine(38-40) synthase TruA [Gammaproteobacteria bacterium]
MRIALGVEYDGSAFHGWQAQQSGIRTVEQQVAQALSRVADNEIEVVCAGRTDRGVHAWGQVVHFDSTVVRPIHSWMLGANSNLPSDVAVQWAHQVADDFHARFSALKRRYRYLIHNHRSRPAIHAQRLTWITQPLAEVRMVQASLCLLGEHDFSAFRASECQAKSPTRRIESLTVERRDHWIIIEITANAFLHHMVRNIVGTLLAVGCGKQPVEWVAQVLQGRDRRAAGATAPAHGLYLIKIDYPPQFNVPAAIIPDYHNQ